MKSDEIRELKKDDCIAKYHLGSICVVYRLCENPVLVISIHQNKSFMRADIFNYEMISPNREIKKITDKMDGFSIIPDELESFYEGSIFDIEGKRMFGFEKIKINE